MTYEYKTSKSDPDVVVRGNQGIAALGLLVGALDEELAYHLGYVYMGHTLRRQERGWLMVLKADSARGKLVTFIGADDLMQLYRRLWLVVYKDMGKWSHDKYR